MIISTTCLCKGYYGQIFSAVVFIPGQLTSPPQTMDNNRNNPDELVAIFDSSWFHLFILTRRRNSIPAAVSSGGGGKESCEKVVGEGMERRSTSSLRERRSKSESIYSGCEVCVGEESREKRKVIKGRRGRRSKSMTELEMEEVKGFMDLGFVFCEEDKDTSLVSIIPGLLLLGENGGRSEEEDEEEEIEGEKKRMPYLSEVWKWRRWGKEGTALRGWKVPASGSEVEVKENLRWWAHAVASAVR